MGVLFEQEKIKLGNKWYFVENRAAIMQNVFIIVVNIFVAIYIKCIFRMSFLHAFTYVEVGCLKVNDDYSS